MSSNQVKLRSKSASIKAYSALVYVVVIFFAILAIIPFWYMFMNATWDTFSIQTGIKLWPNFGHVFEQLKANWDYLSNRSTFSFALGFKNSLIITLSSTFLTVYFSALTAYGLSVYDFKGRKLLFTLIVGVMMVPTAVNITGFYRLMNSMGLLGTRWPLILPAIAAPATVFFIKQYLDSSFSLEIVEAARIDGAGEFRIFNQIVMDTVFTTPVLHQWFEEHWIAGPFVLFPIGFFPPLLLSYIFNKYKWLKWTIGG